MANKMKPSNFSFNIKLTSVVGQFFMYHVRGSGNLICGHALQAGHPEEEQATHMLPQKPVSVENSRQSVPVNCKA